jgi:hypothetical protein
VKTTLPAFQTSAEDEDITEMLVNIKSLSSVENQTPFSLSLAVTKLFLIINCDVRVIK